MQVMETNIDLTHSFQNIQQMAGNLASVERELAAGPAPKANGRSADQNSESSLFGSCFFEAAFFPVLTEAYDLDEDLLSTADDAVDLRDRQVKERDEFELGRKNAINQNFNMSGDPVKAGLMKQKQMLEQQMQQQRMLQQQMQPKPGVKHHHEIEAPKPSWAKMPQPDMKMAAWQAQ